MELTDQIALTDITGGAYAIINIRTENDDQEKSDFYLVSRSLEEPFHLNKLLQFGEVSDAYILNDELIVLYDGDDLGALYNYKEKKLIFDPLIREIHDTDLSGMFHVWAESNYSILNAYPGEASDGDLLDWFYMDSSGNFVFNEGGIHEFISSRVWLVDLSPVGGDDYTLIDTNPDEPDAFKDYKVLAKNVDTAWVDSDNPNAVEVSLGDGTEKKITLS